MSPKAPASSLRSNRIARLAGADEALHVSEDKDASEDVPILTSYCRHKLGLLKGVPHFQAFGHAMRLVNLTRFVREDISQNLFQLL